MIERESTLATCQNCKSKWTWKQVFKKSFTLDTGMYCSYCGRKQYVTSHSRKRSMLITMAVLTFVFIMNILFGPSTFYLILLLLSIPLIMLLYPYWIELSNKEEHLF
ncbi:MULTISPECIES: TIGR04104 family putative zinc finger protein [Virgibacillus]|uniref:TIGR04104 family putative zinc finger protein n=1 Tax=Virgibacillus TaxID=84406 RepID=UPI00094428E8